MSKELERHKKDDLAERPLNLILLTTECIKVYAE